MIKVDINILFTVIDLLLLFFVIWKFLFKPVKKIIAKRQEEVQSQYDEADKAKAEAEETRQKLEEKIKATEEEKAQILKESRAQAGAEYDKIVASAHAEADGIIESAKRDASDASELIRKKANEEIGDLVSKAAAKIAATKEDPELDRRLFEDFLAQTEKAGDSV